ncbi:cell division protein FtsQ/DivIB [Sphingomonas sp.]|uniref:cell division protein FtsQ/DivIB n=1 Tax=Sphingomonas sp. TaxID=28214 RepID=UPI001D85C5B8|nr:cell division protein FtsQ/DivIB [Sphingomonas sp.]MBX9795284.1 FtsQ-type POTRA domain-containing protein [Sphingomonas sp.]
MSKTLRRGTTPQRAAAGTSRRVPAIRRQTMVERVAQKLPVSPQFVRRLITLALTGAVLAVLLAIASILGVPQAAGLALAEAAGDFGFRVRAIEVKGAERMDANTVYAAVLDQESRAMPLVNLGAVRARLLKYGWIADAQVARRLPDKLVVTLVERKEAALWQQDGRLMLIDAGGTPLEAVAPEKAPNLPLLIGPGANRQARDYQQLLSVVPALKDEVKAATWVGNRRWDLMFASGEILALPEENPARALVKFAEIDGKQTLLGRGWAKFDMRDPAKLVVRKGEAVRPITDTSAIITPAAGEEG